MATIRIKRIYEPAGKSDGFRVLVDRLWPRGMKKEDAHIDAWIREVAPSSELRKWFNHDPEKWEGFKKSYKAELNKGQGVKELLREVQQHKSVTLLYGAKDETHNQAVVLQQYLQDKLG